MDLSIVVGEVRFQHPFLNAGGLVKWMEDVQEIVRAPLAGIEIGSITVKSRPGNSGIQYGAEQGVFSLNSLGIPNPGLPYYQDHGMLKEMIGLIHDSDKVAIVNVAGFNEDEFVLLTEVALSAGADVVVENFGCPNIVEEKGETLVRKPVIAYDLAFCTSIVLSLQSGVTHEGKQIWIKGSPFSNPADRSEFISAISNPIVTGVVSTNTLPACSAYYPDGSLMVTANNGYAGYAGPGLKPIALAHVREYSQLWPTGVHVATGGIASGQDAIDYGRAGADLFGMTTALLDPDGIHRYDRVQKILEEYVELCEKGKMSEQFRFFHPKAKIQ